MGQDCLWDSEEQNREYTFHSIPYVAPRCPRGSLVPYKNKEQNSCSVHSLGCSSLFQRQSRLIMKGGANQLFSPISLLLLAIPKAVLSHTKARSRSPVQSILCDATRCPRGSLVPYKSKENQFHPVLALQGRVPRCIKLCLTKNF